MAETTFTSLVKSIEEGKDARWHLDGYLRFADNVNALWNYVGPIEAGLLLPARVSSEHPNFGQATKALTNAAIWAQPGLLATPNEVAETDR